VVHSDQLTGSDLSANTK